MRFVVFQLISFFELFIDTERVVLCEKMYAALQVDFNQIFQMTSNVLIHIEGVSYHFSVRHWTKTCDEDVGFDLRHLFCKNGVRE